jgi:hypothetical protein
MRKLAWMFLTAGMAASAQAQRQPIPVGARVKLLVIEQQRQEHTRFMRRISVRGELVAQSAESIWVRPTPLTGVLAVPRSEVRRVYESHGAPSRVANFFIEGIMGAAFGALECAVLYDVEAFGRSRCGAHSRGDAALQGAAVGFVVFGLVGAALPVEYWRHGSIR